MPRVGKKGGVSEKTDHRIPVSVLSIGYKFTECLKVGLSRVGLSGCAAAGLS